MNARDLRAERVAGVHCGCLSSRATDAIMLMIAMIALSFTMYIGFGKNHATDSSPLGDKGCFKSVGFIMMTYFVLAIVLMTQLRRPTVSIVYQPCRLAIYIVVFMLVAISLTILATGIPKQQCDTGVGTLVTIVFGLSLSAVRLIFIVISIILYPQRYTTDHGRVAPEVTVSESQTHEHQNHRRALTFDELRTLNVSVLSVVQLPATDASGSSKITNVSAPAQSNPNIGVDYVCCAICLEEYKHNDHIVHMQQCVHQFHRDCIMTWLMLKNECPCCRTPAVKV